MPIDFNGLDTTVHGPIRLGALTALKIDGPADFTTLKKRLQTSDGALGMHLRTLEQTGYIASKKAFVGRRPKTTYRLTPAGRKALAAYLDSMQKLLDAVQKVERKNPQRRAQAAGKNTPKPAYFNSTDQ